MIYFIRMAGTDFVKIGYSESPKGRLRHLQTAHPADLEIMVKVHGSMKMERALHRHFKAQRVRGEWFTLSGPLESFLSTLTAELDTARAVGVERLLASAREHGCELIQYLDGGDQ